MAILTIRKSVEVIIISPRLFSRHFRDPIRVPRIENRVSRIRERKQRIRENRVPRIREIGSLQVRTGYLTFSLKNPDITTTGSTNQNRFSCFVEHEFAKNNHGIVRLKIKIYDIL